MKRAALLLLLCIGMLAASCSSPELCGNADAGTYPCDQGVRCEGETTTFGCGDTYCDSASQFCFIAVGVDAMVFPGVCTYYTEKCSAGCGCDCVLTPGESEQCTGTVATGLTIRRNNLGQQ